MAGSLSGIFPSSICPISSSPPKQRARPASSSPRLAYSRDKNGLDIEIPFYWAVSDSSDATFSQRYLEKRGFKEGVEFRYAAGADSFGVFYGDFINDRKRVTDGVGTMSRDWQDDRNRWSYYLNHETTFADGFSLRSDIRRVSDRWYFKDFSSFNYYLDHYSPSGEERFSRVSFLGDESLGSLDSTVRLTKDWSLYNLTALARYTDDFSSPTTMGRCRNIRRRPSRDSGSPSSAALFNSNSPPAMIIFSVRRGRRAISGRSARPSSCR